MNLTKVDRPRGSTYCYTYDANGNLTSETDPLGLTTDVHLRRQQQPDQLHGRQGQYHQLRLQLSKQPAVDHLRQRRPSSNTPTTRSARRRSSSNANGQAIGYTYNAHGLVATETFADGTSYSYTYNSQGNLTSATDAQGNDTTFIYGDPSNPDLLTEVDYPDGTWLKFSYNIIGQRTQSVDQTGFTVNYSLRCPGPAFAVDRRQRQPDRPVHLR